MHEAIPDVVIDHSLSGMKNLKFLIDYFKEYGVGLKGKLEKEAEKENDRKLMDVMEKCASAHNKFQENLKGLQACVVKEKA